MVYDTDTMALLEISDHNLILAFFEAPAVPAILEQDRCGRKGHALVSFLLRTVPNYRGILWAPSYRRVLPSCCRDKMPPAPAGMARDVHIKSMREASMYLPVAVEIRCPQPQPSWLGTST